MLSLIKCCPIFYRFCAFFSLTMVLISTFTFIISTIDELQYNEKGEVEFPLLLQAINVIDVITVSFFTLEYFIRLACSPRKLKFIKGPMNMIDLLAIIPFYLSLLLEGLEDFEIGDTIAVAGVHFLRELPQNEKVH